MASLYTIGFTKSTAESFFGRLRAAGVKRVLDVRLNRGGQLSGFAKEPDLAFFLREIVGAEYTALTVLAPDAALLNAYQRREIDGALYDRRYLALIKKRKAEEQVDAGLLPDGCLLCSEHLPAHCHRRVAAEYLVRTIAPELAIVHL